MPIERVEGKTVFRLHKRPAKEGEFSATDAKLIGELNCTFNSAMNKSGVDGKTITFEPLIISTPNADYLPDINLGHQILMPHADGRWGQQDFGQWPQWYFDDQDHFPYILRRPSSEYLPNHPLRHVWFDMDEEDFVPLNDSAFGVLRTDISRRIFGYRTDLLHQVANCHCESGADFNKLHEIANNMRNTTSALLHTPQSVLNVALTLTAAQRYILETRAFLDKINTWDKMSASLSPRPVDNTILGCVTDRPALAHGLFQMGVPVWFVRPPSHITDDITILKQCDVTTPEAFQVVMTRLKGGHIFYQGPLDRAIHKTIQKWKPGVIDFSLLENTSEIQGDLESNSKAEEIKKAPYSKNVAVSRVAAKGQKYAVNKQLFQPLVGIHFSQPLSAWKDALLAVNTNVALVENPLRSIFRGYAFPPPLLFSGENEAKVVGMILAWILIRPLWITTISDRERTKPLPGPQQWRDHLNDVSLRLGLAREDTRSQTSNKSEAQTISGRKQKKAERRMKIKSEIHNIFTISLPKKEDVTSINWNDHDVWGNKVITLSAPDRKLVVWDSQEHNFRLEFLTLDRCVLPDTWKTTDGRASREQLHEKMWPDGVLLMIGLPSPSGGFGAPNWVERRSLVKAFQDILIDWPGTKHLCAIPFHTNSSSGVVWDQTRMEEFERQAAIFYCQTFFAYFGRAPVIPHSFPPT